MEGIEKSLDILCNIRELSTLVDIRNCITEKKSKLNYGGANEYDYFAIKSRFETLEELENLINDKIKEIKNK